MSKSSARIYRPAAIYRRLFGYAIPYWPMAAIAIPAMALFAATDGSIAWLMGDLIDKGFDQDTLIDVFWIPILLLGIAFIRAVAGFLSQYYMNSIGRNVIRNMRGELLDQYMRLPASYYDQNSSAVLLSRLTYNVELVAESTTSALVVLIQDSLTILVLLGVMFAKSSVLTLFILVTTPLIAWLMTVVSKWFRRYSTRIQSSMGDVTRVTEEALEGHRVIKIFGGQDYEKSQFAKVNEQNRRSHMKLVATKSVTSALVLLIGAVGIAGVVFMATRYLAPLDQITSGDFTTFLSAMLLLTAPLKRLTNINVKLQHGIAAGKNIFETLDETPEPTGGDYDPGRVDGNVEFENVSFSYDDKMGSVLSDVTLSVTRGHTVAIVGRSGSGKSTLVSLLPRFYDASAGRILLDGHDIRELDITALRRQISLVSQDVILFNDSIANNIAYGVLDKLPRITVERAARAAHVMEFVEDMPDGLNTIVGDRGALLSGGQRQRIAIARALLKDAPILILDEATSALDTESERKIQAALEELMANRTTFVIAHRLSTVENADQIVVMDDGHVVEQGTHTELMKHAGHYANLHHMQFADFDTA